MYQNITYIYHVHQHDITHGPVYIFLLIQPRIQNLSLDQRCHLLSQSATCFLSRLEHWNKESSHLYIYTPGLPHRGEEHGLALQEVKIKVTKLVLYLSYLHYHTKERLLKKYFKGHYSTNLRVCNFKEHVVIFGTLYMSLCNSWVK